MSFRIRPMVAAWPLRAAVCSAACSTVACVLPLVASAPAWAQSSPATAEAATLPNVNVSARRDPDKSTLTQPDVRTARERVQRTPGGAAVLDADDYAQGRVSTLSDALGMATGVFVQPRFGAEEARLSIRGSGLQRTFHGRGLKLMQDGVPLNLADGSFDFQAVEPLSARYVEVWRGANALQYGSAALGGAVNFVSPNGYNADRVRLRAEVGSFGYRRALAQAAGVTGNVDYYVATSVFRQDGFRDHARQDSRRNTANLGWQLGPKLETRVYLSHVDSNSELPGSITRAQLERDPEQANAGTVAGDQHRDIRWTRVASKTVYRDGGHQFEVMLYGSDKTLHHPIFQVLDQRNHDSGLELRYVLEGELAGRRNLLTLGLAPSQGRTNEQRYVNVGGNSGAVTGLSRMTARNLEAYVENQHHLNEQWVLVTGVQSLRATRRLQDRYIPAGQVDESFDQAYNATSPKLGLRWDRSPTVQFYANVSGSAEPPSFSELAGGATPTLNAAQRAVTLELGSRGRLRNVAGHAELQWDVSAYRARLRDELLTVALNSLGNSVTVNASGTLHQGLELGLQGAVQPWAALPGGRAEWRLNALLNDFRFRNDPVYGDGALPGLPRHTVRAELAWRWTGGQMAGTRVALNAESAGGYPIDFARTFHAKAYTVWGLKATGEFTPSLSWFVEGRNLGDARYASATGIVRSAGGLDTAQFLPGDGRAVYTGLDWRFN